MYCNKPFTKLVVGKEVFRSCCPSWMESDIWVNGSYLEEDPWDAWNHPKYQELRQKILDGDRSCCKTICPIIRGNLGYKKRDWHKVVMERGPCELVFSTDPSCNLHCWSCRRYPKVDMDNVELKQERVWKYIRTFQSGLARMTFTANGDPLASPVFRPILQNLEGRDFPHTNITLFTNGLLLPRYWESLSKIHCIIDAMAISIDAATKETYEKMRRGGRWEDLQEALALVKSLKLKTIWFNFVVCQTNFQEMPAFLELAKQYGALVRFASVRKWKEIDSETFSRENISHSKHPRHEDFKQVLGDLCIEEARMVMVTDENHIGIS